MFAADLITNYVSNVVKTHSSGYWANFKWYLCCTASIKKKSKMTISIGFVKFCLLQFFFSFLLWILKNVISHYQLILNGLKWYSDDKDSMNLSVFHTKFGMSDSVYAPLSHNNSWTSLVFPILFKQFLIKEIVRCTHHQSMWLQGE